MTFPKVIKRLRIKRDADRVFDKAESVRVRARSGGRCEVREVFLGYAVTQCASQAAHVMHLIGGRGKRGRGISALKEHKLHACAQHHREIDGDLGGKKLKRVGGAVPLWTDFYMRIT